MSTLVESLKRLYQKGRITIDRLLTMVTVGTITQEEYEYIIGENHEDDR